MTQIGLVAEAVVTPAQIPPRMIGVIPVYPSFSRVLFTNEYLDIVHERPNMGLMKVNKSFEGFKDSNSVHRVED
jgi:hypothetical protein